MSILPQKLEHAFAIPRLLEVAKLRSVQALFFHIYTGTTEIYTRVAQDHVRAAYDRAHPRA